MNVRLAQGAIRIRVTRPEFEVLLSSRALTLDVSLPRNRGIRVSVRPALLGGWTLDSDPTGLWVAIPRVTLEEFAASLPSREGLEHSFELADGETLLLSLEVDVKKSPP